jgi:hypothetical protein
VSEFYRPMADQLAQILQAALSGQSGSDASTQLLMALSATVQQQAAQTTMLQQQLQTMEQRLAAASSTKDDRGGLVDTKTLGKMDKFKGGRKEWPDWSFTFKAFLSGVDGKALEAMSWAESQTDLISDEAIDSEDQSQIIHKLNGQIYTALGLLVQGDALDKLRQVPPGAGLDAWRRIVAYYEPMNRGHKLKVLQKIINPKLPPGMNALKALESWEESLSAYEKRFQTKVDADAKMGALLQMLPEVLREHLYMNADRYSNYDAMRAAAVLYLEEKQDRNGTADENVPMEVETRLLALEKGKGKGKKGKDKDGKGKDGKGKGKAKDGKGKGK